jgi:hypothetical protein
MIEVFDNFFSEEIHNEIFDLLTRPMWSFTGGQDTSPFWHMEALDQEEYFKDFLYGVIKEKLGIDYETGRIYANGQTAGQSGSAHIDDNDFTFLYYPNITWKPEWKGELIFLDSDKQPFKVVGYKPNRALLFPGRILHYANGPDRFFGGMRISLAYKLWN